MPVFRPLTAVVFVAAAVGSASAQRANTTNYSAYDYAVVQSVPVPGGRLRVLQDDRINRALSARLLQGCADVRDELGENDPRVAQFIKKPLPPARIQQVDEAGKVIAEYVPDPNSSVARIEDRRLGSDDKPMLMIDTNNNACMGSYSGRGTWFYQDIGGRVGPVMLEQETPGEPRGRPRPLAVFSTLKTAARIEKTDAPNILIHQVFCRPDFEHEPADKNASMPFRVYYETVRYDGAAWSVKVRQEPGYWEMEDRDSFPPVTLFPD